VLNRKRDYSLKDTGVVMQTEGKVFVVTGGGNGIGREVVLITL
jgi:hypothetical protein